MKKTLLVLTLVGCMVMSLSFAAMASNAYVGGVVGGKWENNISDKDDDLDLGFVLGGEYNFLDKFKVGLEYLSGTQESAEAGKDVDYDSYEVKFGYRLVQNQRFNLDAILAYYDESYDDAADTEIDGILLGADMSYIFNDKFSVNGTLGFSVDGSVDANSHATYDYDGNDADIIMVKLQGNYNITKEWSAFLGYRYISSDIDDFDDINNQSITVGAAYKF